MLLLVFNLYTVRRYVFSYGSISSLFIAIPIFRIFSSISLYVLKLLMQLLTSSFCFSFNLLTVLYLPVRLSAIFALSGKCTTTSGFVMLFSITVIFRSFPFSIKNLFSTSAVSTYFLGAASMRQDSRNTWSCSVL